MMNKVCTLIFLKQVKRPKCLVPVNMTTVSTGILDDDGSDGNGQHTNDTEQINDANLLCQHKEQ